MEGGGAGGGGRDHSGGPVPLRCALDNMKNLCFKLGLGRIFGSAGLSDRISGIRQEKPDCPAYPARPAG